MSPIDAEMARLWLVAAQNDGKGAVSRTLVDLVKQFASHKADVP